MLKTLPIRRLTSAQAVSLVDKLIAAASSGLPAGDAISRDVLADCMTGNERLNTALREDPKSPFTRQKMTADTLRDNRLKRIIYLLRGVAEDLEEEAAWREAAARLLEAVDRRTPRFYDLGYAENSGELELLVEDWDEPEATTDFETLGLTARYAKLKAAQTAFLALEQEAAEEADSALVAPAKSDLHRDFGTLFTIVNHFARKSVEPYANLASVIENLVGEQVAIARRRDTLGETDEEASEPEVTTD